MAKDKRLCRRLDRTDGRPPEQNYSSTKTFRKATRKQKNAKQARKRNR